MSQLNGRKIAVARIETPAHVTGLGNLGPVIDKKVLPALNSGRITLEYLDGNILVRGKGILDSIIAANRVITMEFEAETNSKG